MIVNRRPGKCQSCNQSVPAGKGFAYKNGSRWFVTCASTACHSRLGLKSPVPEAKQVRRLTEDGIIEMPFDREALPLLRSMPGARWNPDKKMWSVSIEPGDLPRVLEVADQLKLEVPELLRMQAAVGTTESQDALDRAEAARRHDGKALYPYQKKGVEFLALHDRALLADDMGLGKTVQTIIALPDNEPVICIVPAAVKYNWRDEIQMWRKDLRVHICNGKNSFRLPEPGEVIITNYEILPAWLTPKKESGITTRAGKPILVADLTREQAQVLSQTTVVADEAQKAKNYKAARSQRMTQLCKNAKRVWLLTGTPLMNNPADLFGVMAAGDMYPLGGWNKFAQLFNGYKNRWGGWELGMPTSEVPERMKRVMLRRLKSEVLKDLPPKTYQSIYVNDMSKALRDRLNDYVIASAVMEGHIEPADVTKVLVKDQDEVKNLASKLDMSSLPSFDEFSEIRALLAEARIPAMLEEVESYEDSGTPLVVFSAHKAPIKELAKRDGWEIITGDTSPEKRNGIVKAFQAGKLKGLGLTIQAGGVGITLTHASNALFVDLDWTPAWNLQAEDRMCIARGQLVSVRDKGYIPIEDVVVGDLVFTKTGRWKPVLNTHSRQHRKLLTTIKYKRFGDNLVCTHDHKLLVKRGSSDVQWIEAHLVLPGDFLVTPRQRISNDIQIDSVRFPPEFRHDPSQKNQFGADQNNGRYVEIPGFVDLNDESLFAFGLYLAQGFSSCTPGKGRFVSWSVHSKNIEQLERVQRWLNGLGVNSSIYHSDGEGVELRGYSIELANWFKYLFGRTAPDKHIPNSWIENFSKSQLEKLLAAYLNGDGYRRNSQSEWGTVSKLLAMQINLLVSSLGFASSITVDRTYSGKTQEYWKGVFTSNPKPSNHSLNMIDDEYIYHPVQSVQTEFAKRGENKLIVYDLEVEEDESFLVGNAIVHNCRIGQTSNTVLIKRMTSTHPLDQHMQQLIEYKMELAYKALEASHKFTPIKPRPLAQDIELLEESEEELAERIREAEAEAEREIALGKLGRIAAREAAKVNDTPEPELTPARKQMLREALDYMVERCDMALTRDYQGFNKPDAYIGHWLAATGLREDDDMAFRVLERILVRYRRQLKGQFEAIWKPDLKASNG